MSLVMAHINVYPKSSFAPQANPVGKVAGQRQTAKVRREERM